ncbi:50S ribosomal protein L1 [Candidatus Woesearchaeota archaeon]|nr:50S ribosomal protein L1 [Candidatus Woesearchaeota archaeon]
MDKSKIQAALKIAKEQSGKRNFKQTIDLIVTMKDMDLKKPDHQVDFFLPLHHSNGKDVKVCGLVGPEMKEAAEKELDFVVVVDDFEQYAKDKKKIKKLAETYDYFIAQANLMAKVAQTFGRVFGPKNKMPNPKSGCVVPPNANLAALKQRLKNTVRVMVKTTLQYQVAIAKEDMDEEIIIDNALTVYNQLVHHLPSEVNNIKDVFIKLTMGPAVKVGADEGTK